VFSLMMVRKAKISLHTPHKGGALQGFWEALLFIKSEARLVDLIVFVVMLTFFGMAIILNILPAVATDVLHGDASVLGVLMSASGAGALIGTVFIAPWVQTLRRTGLVLSIAMIFSAISFMVLGLSNVQALSMLGIFIGGLSAPPIFTTVMGLLQFNSPPEMRARVMGLFAMVSFGLQPIAALWIGWSAAHFGLWIGWSAAHFGIQQAILLNAGLLLAGALFMLSRTSLRKWKNHQTTGSIKRLTEAEMSSLSH
jgi:MFS family permease